MTRKMEISENMADGFRHRGICLLLWILLCTALSAQVWGLSRAWTSGGPMGGEVKQMAVDPTDPSILYAATFGAGVFKSVDGGLNWSPSSDGLGGTVLTSILLAPENPTTLYVGSFGQGVFKSADGGDHWYPASQDLSNALVSALAMDPLHQETLFAGILGDGVYKSTDAGGSWIRKSAGLGQKLVTALAVHPTNPSLVLAGTINDGLFRSDNGGESWNNVFLGLPNLSISSIAFVPSSPDTFFLATNHGILKSLDGGQSWRTANVGLTGTCAQVLVAFPAAPGILLAGTDAGGIFRTTNGGESWTASNEGLQGYRVTALAVHPTNQGGAYAATAVGVHLSTDGGQSWTLSTEGIQGSNATCLALPPAARGHAYVGIYGAGVYATVDGGDSWYRTSQGLQDLDVRSLAVDPDSPSTLYAGSWQGHIFKSVNGGASWFLPHTGALASVESLAVSPASPGSLFAGTWGSGVFKSSDGGSHWEPASQGLTSQYVAQLTTHPLNPGVLYAATLGGVFRSDDGGGHWGPRNSGLNTSNVWGVAVSEVSPNLLYAATDIGLFRSQDEGQNWQGPLGPAGGSFNFVAADGSDPLRAYAASASGLGVWVTDDGGLSWNPFNQGLTTGMVYRLALEKGWGHLYAATPYRGVFQIRVGCPPISFQPSSPLDAVRDASFSATFSASGGVGPYAYSITGDLPPGVLFDGATATLSGVPEAIGTWRFTLEATDAEECAGSQAYEVQVACPPLSLLPDHLPQGTAGQPYPTQTFGLRFGREPVLWSASGSIPLGMQFSQGTLSGTPVQSGTFPFQIHATEAEGCEVARSYELVVGCPALSVLPESLPVGGMNAPFPTQTFSLAGAMGSVVWSHSGPLPEGLAFSNGVLSGTPTQSGVFPVVVTGTDGAGCSESRLYELVVTCPGLEVQPSTLPTATLGMAYPSVTLTLAGATGAVTWSLVGPPPPGMTFQQGVLGGTPLRTGTFSVTVRAQVEGGCVAQRTLVLNANRPPRQRAWGWGSTTYAQTGDGVCALSLVPVPLEGLSGVFRLDAGNGFSLCLHTDGTVSSWGLNDRGQLGNGTTEDAALPRPVPGLAQIVALSAGTAHSLALKADGTVWAWGANDKGQLGNGTTADSPVPVLVAGLDGVVAVAAGGSHSLAVKADGTVWGWGNNSVGQLGGGPWQQSLVPVQVNGLTGVTAVAAGSLHSVALKQDQSVWTWGASHYAEGGGDGDPLYTPVQVASLPPASAVACGYFHTLVLAGGQVWAWGRNEYGQLGNGGQAASTTPVPVSSLPDAGAIEAGANSSFAVAMDGSLWGWGKNAGILGHGDTEDYPLPVSIPLAAPVVSLSAGAGHVLAEDSAGALWVWGWNGNGAFGNGHFGYQPWPEVAGALPADIDQIEAGSGFALALDAQGRVLSWGANSQGQLGRNDGQPFSCSPEPVPDLLGVQALYSKVSHSLALSVDGTLWAWGWNGSGQLGNGTTQNSTVPVQVQGLRSVVLAAAGGAHSLAVTENGTLWAWGRNQDGQLGIGTSVSTSVPVPVSTLSNVTALAGGGDHSLALLADGTVWAWGWNDRGQVGDGTTTMRTSPVRVSSLSGVVAIAAGDNFSLALKDDGTVWAWGDNQDHQLGNGTTLSKSTIPRQVEALSGIRSIAAGSLHSLALGSDGSVWAWGRNWEYQLGTGSDDRTLVPVRVPGLTGASWIEAAGNTSFAGSPCPVLLLEPAILPVASLGRSYLVNLAGGGGKPPYVFSLVGGALPPGLTLDQNGVLTGIPTVVGTFPFSLALTDGAGCAASFSMSLSVVTPPAVDSIQKLASPFRLKLVGSAFQQGIQVFLDGQPWSQVQVKSPTSLLLKGGKDLAARFPKGVPVSIRLVNPDGGVGEAVWTR